MEKRLDEIIEGKAEMIKRGAAQKSTIQFLKSELMRLMLEPASNYTLKPTESDILTWYFLIHGDSDTDYKNGCYMGVLYLPPDFPYSPPEVQMISPTGKFELRSPICMTNTAFYPLKWQPSWSLSNFMTGLISFLYSGDTGAGCLAKQEKTPIIRDFAGKSKGWLYDRCKIFKVIFENEYDIISKAISISLNERYILNDPIQTEARFELVNRRFEIYQSYDDATKTILECTEKLHEYFSAAVSNDKINEMKIVPYISDITLFDPAPIEDEVNIFANSEEEESEFEFETDEEEEEEEQGIEAAKEKENLGEIEQEAKQEKVERIEKAVEKLTSIIGRIDFKHRE